MREVLCMCGPDVEFHAAVGRPRREVYAAGAAANFPGGGKVVVRVHRHGGGARSAVLSRVETLREYRRARPGSQLIAPVTLIETLTRAGILPRRQSVLIVAATWLSLVLRAGDRVEDVRSDLLPRDPSDRDAAIRAFVAQRSPAGVGESPLVLSVGPDGDASASIWPQAERITLSGLSTGRRVPLGVDFESPRRRLLRGVRIGLFTATALPVIWIPLMSSAASEPSGPSETVAPRVPNQARAAVESAVAGPISEAKRVPEAKPAPDPEEAAPAPARPAPHQTVPARPAPPEARFAFAGAGRSAEGARVWYFLDRETRRVVTVGDREVPHE